MRGDGYADERGGDISMSGIPTPKYAMGQKVYYASTIDNTERLPCPDCKGTQKWSLTTPAGESFETSCQRCASGYTRVDDTPSLWVRKWHPSVTTLTVGQIRIETTRQSSWNQDEVQYMCCETGVGSGSVYDESKLYGTHDAALQAAEADARAKQAEWDARPDRVRQGTVATLRLSDALGESGRHTIWSVSYHARQLRETVEGWLETDSDFHATEEQADIINEAIRSLEWHDGPEQNPLTALILAAREAAAAHPDAHLSSALSAFDWVREPAKQETWL